MDMLQQTTSYRSVNFGKGFGQDMLGTKVWT